MKKLIILIFAMWPVSVFGQETLEQQARAALAALDTASAQLAQVDGARDRVRALTEAIYAHEAGLSTLREGMRKVTARETALTRALRERDAEIGALLSVLQRLGDNPSPVSMMHPGGAAGSMRAGMLLSEMVPNLNVTAEELRLDLQELQSLRGLQQNAIAQLEAGLSRLQSAREALNLAISDREPLPKRFVNDPVSEAVLVASSDTMAQFAEGLDRISVGQIATPSTVLRVRDQSLLLPVAGQVVFDAGERDAAGIKRPGIIVSTLPGAVVTTPLASTVRYTGPLLDYGQVVILEPMQNLLFIFAGLDTLYVTAGEVVDEGVPVGLMGYTMVKNSARQSTDGELTGAELTETLYIEIRKDDAPENPGLWFRMDKDG